MVLCHSRGADAHSKRERCYQTSSCCLRSLDIVRLSAFTNLLRRRAPSTEATNITHALIENAVQAGAGPCRQSGRATQADGAHGEYLCLFLPSRVDVAPAVT